MKTGKKMNLTANKNNVMKNSNHTEKENKTMRNTLKIPELGQHLQHVDTDLLRIVIQTSADDTEAVRCQYPAMQLVGLVLLILLIFLIRYLLHGSLRSSL